MRKRLRADHPSGHSTRDGRDANSKRRTGFQSRTQQGRQRQSDATIIQPTNCQGDHCQEHEN